MTTGDACVLAQACCFNKTASTDSCHDWDGSSFSCGTDYLTLACNTDATCDNGKCCAVFSTSYPYPLKGTECRSDCSGSDAYTACDPTVAAPACPSGMQYCTPLLDSYFVSGAASPPYDAYGQCL